MGLGGACEEPIRGTGWGTHAELRAPGRPPRPASEALHPGYAVHCSALMDIRRAWPLSDIEACSPHASRRGQRGAVQASAGARASVGRATAPGSGSLCLPEISWEVGRGQPAQDPWHCAVGVRSSPRVREAHTRASVARWRTWRPAETRSGVSRYGRHRKSAKTPFARAGSVAGRPPGTKASAVAAGCACGLGNECLRRGARCALSAHASMVDARRGPL